VEDCKVYEFELFGVVADEAFEEITGEYLLDYIQYPDPGTTAEDFTPIIFTRKHEEDLP
jgi:hypothetical protein